jgi:hypothetical protein
MWWAVQGQPAAGASVCSAPKMRSERFVVRRKERAAISAGYPAFNITRTVRSPARVGSVSGCVVVEGSGVRTGLVEPTGVVKREGIPGEAVGE